jgi:hypothetical protein
MDFYSSSLEMPQITSTVIRKSLIYIYIYKETNILSKNWLGTFSVKKGSFENNSIPQKSDTPSGYTILEDELIYSQDLPLNAEVYNWKHFLANTSTVTS